MTQDKLSSSSTQISTFPDFSGFERLYLPDDLSTNTSDSTLTKQPTKRKNHDDQQYSPRSSSVMTDLGLSLPVSDSTPNNSFHSTSSGKQNEVNLSQPRKMYRNQSLLVLNQSLPEKPTLESHQLLESSNSSYILSPKVNCQNIFSGQKFRYMFSGSKFSKLSDEMVEFGQNLLEEHDKYYEDMNKIISFGRIVAPPTEKYEEVLRQSKSENSTDQQRPPLNRNILNNKKTTTDLWYVISFPDHKLTLLNLSQLKEFSLFYGQIVGFEGVRQGNQVMVDQLFQPTANPPPCIPRSEECSTSIVISAGPYMKHNSLDLSALHSLFQFVSVHKPSLLIMHGPFVDENHPQIFEGDYKLSEKDKERENWTPQQYFKNEFLNFINQQIQKINQPHQVENFQVRMVKSERDDDSLDEELKKDEENVSVSVRTKIVLIPSVRDFHHHRIFPQPSFNLENNNMSPDIISFPNPSVFQCNDLLIGACSEDVLMELGRSSSFKTLGNVLPDKFSKLSSFLLSQRNFYPVQLPSKQIRRGHVSTENGMENTYYDNQYDYRSQKFPIDYNYFEQLKIGQSPHLLILPSQFSYFAKSVNGVLCVNPGHLCKSEGRGTFAKLTIHTSPTSSESLSLPSSPLVRSPSMELSNNSTPNTSTSPSTPPSSPRIPPSSPSRSAYCRSTQKVPLSIIERTRVEIRKL